MFFSRIFFAHQRPALLARNYFSTLNLRNIGISAHIDSGKTTFTERVLFYSGRINEMHEVKGTDNVGAKMDFMELEREKGITIQSAATFLRWKNSDINVIDTPGHVDFTIEVERALRVLDGAVLLVCGVSGVQPQTYTVFKQMKRYGVPRLIFINKLDRMGANPWNVISSIRSKLGLKCAAVQIPIGLDEELKGLVDIIEMRAYLFEGKGGSEMREITPFPEKYLQEANQRRQELIETVAELDDEVGTLFLEEQEIPTQLLKTAIRRLTISTKFSPVFMGSAIKNKGVQLALDGVTEYLPEPSEKINYGFRKSTAKIANPGQQSLTQQSPEEAKIQQKQEEEEKIELRCDPKLPFVGYAFKLEENRFGQLTYVRVYQGKLRRSDFVWNSTANKKMKITRMVKMHADEMEEIQEAGPGEIFALFGVECSTGDTLTEGDGSNPLRCQTMHVPSAVIQLAITAKKGQNMTKFNKALQRFQREDPTFNVTMDKESGEIILSGMGELHLQIYAERIRREFGIEVELGTPTVSYRETIAGKQEFDYLHKKQTGGAGQFARVIGYLEPLNPDNPSEFSNLFVNKIQGATISNEFVGACEKSFYECVQKGPISGQYPAVNVKFALTDGQIHSVDSSSTAFMLATRYAFLQAFMNASPQLLEPVMNIEVNCQGTHFVRLIY